MKNRTRISIDGKNFTLMGDESEAHMQRVAAYINGKMKEVRNTTAVVLDSSLAYVLTSINVANDYLKELERKDSKETEEASVEKYRMKIQELEAKLAAAEAADNSGSLVAYVRELEEKLAAIEAQQPTETQKEAVTQPNVLQADPMLLVKLQELEAKLAAAEAERDMLKREAIPSETTQAAQAGLADGGAVGDITRDMAIRMQELEAKLAAAEAERDMLRKETTLEDKINEMETHLADFGSAEEIEKEMALRVQELEAKLAASEAARKQAENELDDYRLAVEGNLNYSAGGSTRASQVRHTAKARRR